MRRRHLLLGALAAPAFARTARAADKVRVAIFNVASALPFYTARERGFFAEQGIEAEGTKLQTNPLIVQALVSGDADACSNLVTLEIANINVRRSDSVLLFAVNGQNAEHRMEQFVVGPRSRAKTLADLRGARILSAPGPANTSAAKAVLAAVGLQEGRDYTITEQPMGVHVGALQSGQFDAGYTLEPVGTIGVRAGAMRRLEAGVIATHLLRRPEAYAWASGAGFTGQFLARNPDAAKRYAAAWAKALQSIRTDPSTRAYLTQFMDTPEELARDLPLQDYTMVRDLTPQDRADFQKFVDLAVQQGVVQKPVDIGTFLRPL
ncbi:MAG TPA: ABC transporter substrate-binding protein [Crenalkalicoccus sp.]|nr:ABC transporter substrate-binding protein [Crenalkalicoccus sp.]